MNELLKISKKSLASFQIVDWGYTEELTPTSFEQFEKWIENNQHGSLNYLSDYRKDKRQHLHSVYENCDSALVFLFDYSQIKKSIDQSQLKNKIAAYTLGFEGVDYHYWIKEKLDKIGVELKKEFHDLEYKFALDVHPVLERDLAYRTGLGWFGKNSMLISQKFGSYTIIGSLLLNQKLDLGIKERSVDHCGNCTRCIDVCPTNAIHSHDRTLDAAKCISTFTIEEFKEADIPTGYPTDSGEIFGCDICQEVCPWNNKPIKMAVNVELKNNLLINFFNRDLNLIYDEISKMSNNEFKKFFKHTSFERLGKRGFLKNLRPYLTKG